MKAKLFNDYVEYIYFMEQDMNLKRYQSQDEIAHHYRILHYKSDILLSLLLDIDNRKPISFDTFAAFFDWDFIEQALLNFPASSRFQIFWNPFKNLYRYFTKYRWGHFFMGL